MDAVKTAPLFEGLLQKPARIIGRTTKVWCVLDGQSLMFFKENKRSSCIGHVDISDIQTVRQVNTKDNQFEIITSEKPQIYTAESPDLCKEWVKHLQQAISLKGQDITTSKPKEEHFAAEKPSYRVDNSIKKSWQQRESSSSKTFETGKIHRATEDFKVDLKSVKESWKQRESSIKHQGSPTKSPKSPSGFGFHLPKENKKTPEREKKLFSSASEERKQHNLTTAQLGMEKPEREMPKEIKSEEDKKLGETETQNTSDETDSTAKITEISLVSEVKNDQTSTVQVVQSEVSKEEVYGDESNEVHKPETDVNVITSDSNIQQKQDIANTATQMSGHEQPQTDVNVITSDNDIQQKQDIANTKTQTSGYDVEDEQPVVVLGRKSRNVGDTNGRNEKESVGDKEEVNKTENIENTSKIEQAKNIATENEQKHDDGHIKGEDQASDGVADVVMKRDPNNQEQKEEDRAPDGVWDKVTTTDPNDQEQNKDEDRAPDGVVDKVTTTDPNDQEQNKDEHRPDGVANIVMKTDHKDQVGNSGDVEDDAMRMKSTTAKAVSFGSTPINNNDEIDGNNDDDEVVLCRKWEVSSSVPKSENDRDTETEKVPMRKTFHYGEIAKEKTSEDAEVVLRPKSASSRIKIQAEYANEVEKPSSGKDDNGKQESDQKEKTENGKSVFSGNSADIQEEENINEELLQVCKTEDIPELYTLTEKDKSACNDLRTYLINTFGPIDDLTDHKSAEKGTRNQEDAVSILKDYLKSVDAL